MLDCGLMHSFTVYIRLCYGLDTERFESMPSVTRHYVLLRIIHPCPIFYFFQNLGAGGIGQYVKIRAYTEKIRIVTNMTDRYERPVRSVRSIRMC